MNVIPFQSPKAKVLMDAVLDFQLEFLEEVKIYSVNTRVSIEELKVINMEFYEIFKRNKLEDSFFDNITLFFSDTVYFSIKNNEPLTADYLKQTWTYFLNKKLDLSNIEDSIQKIDEIVTEPTNNIIQFRKK